MAVIAVVLARDMRKHAHLTTVERPVGHRDAQHIGVKLEVEAIHQPQRLELILGDLAREAAAT